ncbi:MAG: toll/interleukin-1 receptor domain-containing protein [Chloroflexota bacterium]|nr:toll/interleukin-1 receptor domain-containing protein [Chloroflexota bacterium]
MATFNDFLTKIQRRALPKAPMERVRILAREMAAGAAEGLWMVSLDHDAPNLLALRSPSFGSDSFNRYLERRWKNQPPGWDLLQTVGYVRVEWRVVEISALAFGLLDDDAPASAFISYRRRDSSALALLVLERLRANGIDAYLDLSLRPGSLWRERIREEIQTRDTLVLLIGRETLASEMVQQEIIWALNADIVILPIWHNSFEYQSSARDLPATIDHILTHTHTIRVLEESAMAYHNALIELVSHFGVMP